MNRIHRHSLAVLVLAFLVLSITPCRATTTLSLLTYNIHSAVPMGHTSSKYSVTEKDLERIADVITSAGAHVVALQEVRREFTSRSKKRPPRRGPDMPRELSRFTLMMYVFGSTMDDTQGFPANTEYLEWGTADLSTSCGITRGEFGNALLTRCWMQNPPENIVLPNAPEKEQRGCLRVALHEPSGCPVVVYATHLQHDSAELRVKQMRFILDRVSRETSGTTVFLMGDLNYAHGTKGDLIAMARAAGFRDLHEQAAQAAGVTPGATFPADKPARRIDYILCNQPVKVTSAKVIDTLASDHLPLLVRVELEQ